MKKEVIAFAVVASLLFMLLPSTVEASTSVYKDYKPPEPLVRNWILGSYGIRLETKSEIKNLVVRAYSDKEIRVWGDFSTTGAALCTSFCVQVMTATQATVDVLEFTWGGLKYYQKYSSVIVGRDYRWPGAEFWVWGWGDGHFEVKISGIAPDETVFGVGVAVGNLGSALAMIFDIYKLLTVPPDTMALIFSIKDQVRLETNIASLLIRDNVFKASDEWPTAPSAPAVATPTVGGTELVRVSAVYYDERYPTCYASMDEARAVRNYLSMRGFTVLDADDLKTLMEDEGKHSVVVMSQDVAPDTVADTMSPTAIIRQYLDRGGRVVWIGCNPFYWQGHNNGTKTFWGLEGMLNILGVNWVTSCHGGTVTMTADGSAAGLTQTWNSEDLHVQSPSVTKVYARVGDQEGAAAWMKSFNNGGEFRRIWDSQTSDFTSDAYLEDLATIATTGSLSWEVEMTAFNADPIYARDAKININGYEKTIISAMDPVTTATVVTTVPGYWFNDELDAINAWVTTIDGYDSGNSCITVKLTSPEGFRIQYYKMKPANLDHKAYFEIEMTGLWRVTTYRYNTSPTALAYNLPDTHTYDTGSRTAGSFMFTVDLKSYRASTLEFYHCYWIDSRLDGAYDVLRVQISTDLGKTWTTLRQWDSRSRNVDSWTKVSLDISYECGHLVQIRFHFDSYDSLYNNYEGWYIDDITVIPVETRSYVATGGVTTTCGDVQSPLIGTWFWTVPFRTRPPYITPLLEDLNIQFSEPQELPGYGSIVYLTVPSESYVGLSQIFWHPNSNLWCRFSVTMKKEDFGYGWVFLNRTGDVDCYTLSDNTGVYWQTPSLKNGEKAADTGALPSPGPDGVAGTGDDGFGDGTPDPPGSSILYLPTWLNWEYYGGAGVGWQPLFTVPWPQILTTGTAYNVVGEPTSEIDRHWNATNGEPWEFYAGLDHPCCKVPWEPWGPGAPPEWHAYVTYACVWSVLEINTPFGLVDMLYKVEERLVREDVMIADVSGDEVCNIVDIVIAALSFEQRDEGPGPDYEYYTADDKKASDPKYDARGDLRPTFGLVNIVDIVRIALDFDKKLYKSWWEFSSSSAMTDAYMEETLTEGTAAISIYPNAITKYKHETFSVNVTITDAANLYGWQFELYWNNTLLNCTAAEIHTPSIWTGHTFEAGSGIQNNYNTTHGRFLKAISALYPAPSFNGSMVVATLTFEAKAVGTSVLDLQETTLVDSQAYEIPHTTVDGSATVLPLLTVLAQDQYSNPLTSGDVYRDGQLVGYTGSTFAGWAGTHQIFVNDFWESGTTGYRYKFTRWEDGSVNNPRSITVLADTTTTVYFTKKWCPGDVNGDNTVNIIDIIIVNRAYGSQRDLGDPWPPNGNWDSRADLNRDGIINTLDRNIVSANFGNQYP